MNPTVKTIMIIASIIAALLYGAPEDFWTKVAGGAIVVAISIGLNYLVTSRTASIAVAKEMGAYMNEIKNLRSDNIHHELTMQRVLQELGRVQGELSRIKGE